MSTEFKLNRVETRVGPVALVTLDNGADHTKPTVLDRSAFESAVPVLDALESGEWKAMVLTGKPFVFAAGADMKEFVGISREAAVEGARAGHGLFGRLAALPMPTVAAINGACVGGGVELALHCSARTISSAVRHFGCPEVFLGLFPAWGGTQLLPRLAGPEAAVKVIVANPMRQNKLLTGRDAFELGLADRLLDPVEFVDESIAYAIELVEHGVPERAAPDWSAAETIFRRARNRVEDAVHGAAPAPYVALDLIEGAREWTLEEGYRAEEEAIGELLPCRQAQASIYAFDVVERRLKRAPWTPTAEPRRVEKIGIVGAGLMATQIATLFVRRLEVPVVLRDLEQETVDGAVASVREEVAERKPFLATLVSGGTDWDRFAGCDLVLEAVFEDLDVKREVFGEVRRVAPDAILATNTSSLSVEEMGADVGIHFFNPVAMMPLVEIVRHDGTTDEQLATAWALVSKLRKRGVVVRDAPGFVVNRVLTRMSTVLADALANGNTIEETDEAALSLGLPMAPSVLLQMVGERVARHTLETLHAAWPDRFPLEPGAHGARRSVDEIREDVLEAVADEIRHLLEEGVVAEAADVDACLILGAGWPFFMGGATKYLDQTGVSERLFGKPLAEISATIPA